MRSSSPKLARLLGAGEAAARLATPTELRSALQARATVVDIRRAGESAEVVDGSVSATWADGALPLDKLPTETDAPLVVYCMGGVRVKAAASYLADRGYTNVINGGGPNTDLWSEYDTSIFVQLFDGPPPEGTGSSTFTYLLGDVKTRDAVIIDPVREQADRDLALVTSLGLNLTLAINTHCHADHVTGTSALKSRVGGLKSAISRASGAKADVYLDDGEEITYGSRALKVIATPGHTDGCVSLHEASLGAIFTGDALLIGGCGRTDFQAGDAGRLYDSVHSRLFTLPPPTVVYPAHDYKGRVSSTIRAESSSNPRLTKTKGEFIQLMGERVTPPRPAAAPPPPPTTTTTNHQHHVISDADDNR